MGICFKYYKHSFIFPYIAFLKKYMEVKYVKY